MNEQLVVHLLVAVVGQAGAGKTTLVKRLAEDVQAPIVSFGGFVRDEAQRRGLPIDRPTLQTLGQQLIAKYGSADFARQVVSSCPGPHHILLIDGVRSIAVWETVRAMAQRSVLVYLDVSEKVRADRIAERDQLDSTTVIAIMHHPLELSIPELRAHAHVVGQDGNVEKVVAQVITMISG